MEIKDHKILLTVVERGRLGAPVSNTSSKKERSAIMTSPFEKGITTVKAGKLITEYITPKKHFKVANDFKEREVLPCTRKNTLQESVVNYFISNSSCPFSVKKRDWEKMNEKQRLEIHLSLNAEGKEFTYEII